MRIFKDNLSSLLFLLLLSAVTILPAILYPQRSANMDGIVHTLVPNLFAKAISQGDFPVTWIDGFANYGLPLGIISHQVTTYLTAFIILIVQNPVVAFNIVGFIGILLSNIFFYLFLKKYFSTPASLTAVVLFNFSPYRILNFYIRGAMPEFFASVFIPLILLSLFGIFKERRVSSFFLLILSVCLLILTHPFMLVVSLFLVAPYILFLTATDQKIGEWIRTFTRKNIRPLMLSGIGFVVGAGMTSYFLLPLQKEIQYFYYGLSPNHLTANSYLTLYNYIANPWAYFTKLDIVHRGFLINVGIIESLLVTFGLGYFIVRVIKQRGKFNFGIFDFALFSSWILIFMMSPLSTVLYQKLPMLSNVQFQWRMLSAFIFLPPIIAAFFLTKVSSLKYYVLLVLAVLVTIMPQLYGKNYTQYPQGYYTFTPLNLHATVMNTIWSGETGEYPITKDKGAIIEGKGNMSAILIKDSKRSYDIKAVGPIRLVDHTFYFPGWTLYVDGQESSVQFQDPAYRGVITYTVPSGEHHIDLVFKPTKTRIIGLYLSLFFVVIVIGMVIFRGKIQRFLRK